MSGFNFSILLFYFLKIILKCSLLRFTLRLNSNHKPKMLQTTDLSVSHSFSCRYNSFLHLSSGLWVFLSNAAKIPSFLDLSLLRSHSTNSNICLIKFVRRVLMLSIYFLLPSMFPTWSQHVKISF